MIDQGEIRITAESASTMDADSTGSLIRPPASDIGPSHSLQ